VIQSPPTRTNTRNICLTEPYWHDYHRVKNVTDRVARAILLEFIYYSGKLYDRNFYGG
jgi:hypothetical protein